MLGVCITQGILKEKKQNKKIISPNAFFFQRAVIKMTFRYIKLLSLLPLLIFFYLTKKYFAPTPLQQEVLWCSNWAVVSLHQHQTPPVVSLHQHQPHPAASPLDHWCLLVLGEPHTGHKYQSSFSGGVYRGTPNLLRLVVCAVPGQDLVQQQVPVFA